MRQDDARRRAHRRAQTHDDDHRSCGDAGWFDAGPELVCRRRRRALLLTGGHIWGAIGEGSRFDAPLVLGGIAIGVLALAAMAWVTADGAWRTAVAWLGIGAGVLPFAVVVWLVLTSASLDAHVLAGIPAALTLAAGVRVAIARAGARPR